MPKKCRVLRDPLKDVPLDQITHIPHGCPFCLRYFFFFFKVVEDHMPKKRRVLRDPLKDVPLDQITLTNLPLLCRFVSDGGAILPRKLTGVHVRKYCIPY